MFIARQPIFNKKLGVYGYELLYRSSSESGAFDGVSSAEATATVIGGLFECGIDCIVGNKYAFINFDHNFVHSDSLELIEPNRLIVEILENAVVDSRLELRLKELKRKGYKIALDDFFESYNNYPLIPIADIIKYDLLETPLATIKQDVKVALSQNKTLLAEKIETKEEFEKAKNMGFHLFQGYFFSKPSITNKTFSESTSRIQYIRIIKELRKEEPSFQRLAEIIERDVTLAYRLVRIASMRSGDEKVYSIKRALTYMGLKESERWVHTMMLRDMGRSKPKELMRMSLIRSNLAEKIVLQADYKKLKFEASMMGLFSVLDAMMDMTLQEALEDINLPREILDPLINNKGELYPIYELILAYEKGDWSTVEKDLKILKISNTTLREMYIKSIEFAKNIMAII